MSGNNGEEKKYGLQSREWLLSYKTSSTIIDGRPVDMLHDFYIPALNLAVEYDRVAGYFRSSSLAAASQGFSSFVGRNGKMRLIVGADLDTDDVRAILAGDEKRLENRLSRELEQEEAWPEDVRNGVQLLSWMIANGYLEVKVAFRIHGGTGKPLDLESVADGYVHEKWFIMRDEYGNKMYGAGALNESKTALLLNAENFDLHCSWWGGRDRQRVLEAEKDFEKLWQGLVPHMPVMSLPEAVKQKLLRISRTAKRISEIDGTPPREPVAVAPSAEELLKFMIIRDAPKMPGGKLVGMLTAPVKPWPHQEIVVRRLVETWPYSYLLCDEVGLGKTIEAGLAFRSLYLSGLVKRILIAAPASLTHQWQRQMASKVLLPFGRVVTSPETKFQYIFPEESEIKSDSIYDENLLIMSTGLLSRTDRAAGLKYSKPFDIALVDEAHNVRRKNPNKGCSANPNYGNLYIAIRDYLRKNSQCLWLATATPMQIDPVEVCDLLALTNRVGAFQYDPTLTLAYYNIFGKLLNEQSPFEDEWAFLKKAIEAVKIQDPIHWSFVENSVIDSRLKTPVRLWLQQGRIPRGRERSLMCRVIFSSSPLSRVMLRHTRPLLEIYRSKGRLEQKLPKRVIVQYPPVQFTALEQQAYERLESYCRELEKHIWKNDKQNKQTLSFLLSFLRLRFASGLFAIQETLRRRLIRVEATLKHELLEVNDAVEAEIGNINEYFEEDEEGDISEGTLLKNRTPADLEWEKEQLKNMLKGLRGLHSIPSKMKALLQIIDRRYDRKTTRIDQLVIFTRFYDTLLDIVLHLRQRKPGMLIGTYSGQKAEYYDPKTKRMITVSREEVKERFLRGEIDVLVCTDAAAEGLNLQTANFLVNFDLGWNPMKVEQRIGRIDRIGQLHDEVYIVNLFYANSAEEIVYSRLLDRLSKANIIVGPQQMSLLPVKPEDFQLLAEGLLTEQELFNRVKDDIEKLNKQRKNMELPPEDLYDIYLKLANTEEYTNAPIELSSIWQTLSESEYLRRVNNAKVIEIDGRQLLMLEGLEGYTERVALTISRELYDEGAPDSEFSIHYASYGDQIFDRVLRLVSKFELPSCIKRITVTVPGMEGIDMVAYAAVCSDTEGKRFIKLICRWPDLIDLNLMKGADLTQDEVETLTKKLEDIARQEFNVCMTAKRVENHNVRAAQAQKILNFLVISDLLKIKSIKNETHFWSVIKDISSLVEERRSIAVSDLPATILGKIKNDLLFECNVPAIGDEAHLSAPQILGKTSVDAAKRIADSMKIKQSELLVETVLKRLGQEVNKRIKSLS